MTREQIARMLIFLKEAAEQIDNARVVAIKAAHHPTLHNIELLLREITWQIDRLELIHRQMP